ncbi:HlyD family efflux transporter periplasmic adaptor subunit [Massilia sp. Leaf139]|uniref:HlyD family efflux transporter periplasmic adaptor subunit n=1 Tax=Massilia sp. Leaf139 TaxID=1736272 RepID=UPI0006F1E8C1|nr:HlyD family efflux transporter periplasmic adaptor subunit [Massilia sp. Leaf139]KQQ94885.1 hypothetical protein ASF77_22350 [Massilia sp. Leaf139]
MTVHSAEQVRQGASAPATEAQLWRAFAARGTDAQFCQAWLNLLCRQLPQVSAAVVLMQSPEANTFLPLALWPGIKRDLSGLGKAAERALTEGRGVVEPSGEGEAQRLHVAYPAEVNGRMVGAVVLEAAPRPEAEVHALLRQLHWGVAWLHDLVQRRERGELESKAERIGALMESVATALRSGRLQQVLFDLANQLTGAAACTRVAIGLAGESGATVKVAALSNAAWFEKNASIMTLYAQAMEDTLDALAPLDYRRPALADALAVAIEDSAHARLVRESGAHVVLSVPLVLGAKCIGVLTLERDKDQPFDAAERSWLGTLAGLLAAVIEQKRDAERGHVARLGADARKLFERLAGPGYLLWKGGAVLALATVLVLALVDIDYRVTAKTVVEGEVQRAAVAPFEGFVAASFARAGDSVRQGQVLARLDDRELRLEQQKWNSEREQYSRKWRDAMARHELAEVQILGAQLQQAEAQLALASDRLRRTAITAPFDGVLISGDLSQLTGSPVQAGEKLFEIAPLYAYRVILQVDERDMRQIRVGQEGKLMISGVVGGPVALSVSKITPVATAQDGRNFFRVEARLAQAPAHLRPGMEGVGKVETGQRPLWWVLTHDLTDWLRLAVWTWWP